MKKSIKFLLLFFVSALSFGMVACSDDDDAMENVNIAGKWAVMAQDRKELLIINSDNTVVSTGSSNGELWASRKGTIELNGNSFSLIFQDGNNSTGTFALSDNQLTLSYNNGKEYTYILYSDDIKVVGKWELKNVESFIKAAKEEISVPTGGADEEEYLTFKTSDISGEFVNYAINSYLRNLEFTNNGVVKYNVIKEGVETPMSKNYSIVNNILKITGKVSDYDLNNQFMIFQNNSNTETYLFLTKENMADMFVSYGFMLRAGDVTHGDVETLQTFRNAFLEAFENYAIIISLKKA